MTTKELREALAILRHPGIIDTTKEPLRKELNEELQARSEWNRMAATITYPNGVTRTGAYKSAQEILEELES